MKHESGLASEGKQGLKMSTSQQISGKAQEGKDVSNNTSSQKQTLMTQFTSNSDNQSSANMPQGHRQTILLEQPNLPQLNHLPQHLQQFYAGD